MKKSLCVFPGSFNPFTLGHKEVVLKALQHFDKVIVAASELTYKKKPVPLMLRAEMIRKSLLDVQNTEVVTFNGMFADYLRSINCFCVVRGYRDDKDIDYESTLQSIYISMEPRITTTLLKTEMTDVSAQLVRELAERGEDYSKLVDGNIINDIKEYYGGV